MNLKYDGKNTIRLLLIYHLLLSLKKKKIDLRFIKINSKFYLSEIRERTNINLISSQVYI